MTELKQKLLEIIVQWRRTSRSTRREVLGIPNLLARGHMQGMSDGLELAANDIDEVVNKDIPPAQSLVHKPPHAPFHADNQKPGT